MPRAGVRPVVSNLRAWLIAGEIAASVILLVGASLLFRSFLS